MSDAVTQWFSPTDCPEWIGVYERQITTVILCYSYWDGVKWGVGDASPESAQNLRHMTSAMQLLPWRGIAK